MSNFQFANLIYAIGKVHYKEQGLIYKSLFSILMQRFKEQILSRQFVANDLAYLIEGTIKLVKLN